MKNPALPAQTRFHNSLNPKRLTSLLGSLFGASRKLGKNCRVCRPGAPVANRLSAPKTFPRFLLATHANLLRRPGVHQTPIHRLAIDVQSLNPVGPMGPTFPNLVAAEVMRLTFPSWGPGSPNTPTHRLAIDVQYLNPAGPMGPTGNRHELKQRTGSAKFIGQLSAFPISTFCSPLK